MAKKNVKVIKNKKKINWNKILFYLKSLINNGVIKEIGIKHWLISIPIFILSLFISVIPILTTEATRNGSSLVNNQYNDVLVEGIYGYINDTETIDFEVNDHTLAPTTALDEGSNVYTYRRENYRFDIYFFDTTGTNLSFNEQVTEVNSNNPNLQSTLYLSSSYYSLTIVNPSTGQAVGSTAGNYNHMDNFASFKNYLSNKVDQAGTIDEIKTGYMNNLYSFLDLGYLDIRVNNVLIYTGICLGINAGITLIVWPILIIMTKGKNNPNRNIKFYQIMGITFHSTLAPAILTLILGYIMNANFSYMTMLYVMMFGFRAMWLSMKYLRPPLQ